MALAERTPLGVLTGQSDRQALGQERRERERLGVGPQHAPVGMLERLAPLLELLGELGVNHESVWHRQELLAEHPEPLCRDRRLDFRRRGAVELVLAGLGLDVAGGGDPLLERLMRVAQDRPDVVGHLGRVLLGDHSLVDQLPGEQLSHRRVLLDHLVHRWLRVGGLVGLVVPEAPVADQVDEDVVPELLTERERQPHRGDARSHVVGVDVDDRDVEALGEV